jgi:hypothetical protein
VKSRSCGHHISLSFLTSSSVTRLENQFEKLFDNGSVIQKEFDNFKLLTTFIAKSAANDYNIGFVASK